LRPDAVGALGRIVPLAAAVHRGVRRLGLVGLAAAAGVALAVIVRWTPSDEESWAGLFVLCVLLVLPPVVLLAFSLVLSEVVEVPDKLRRYPGTARRHAEELRELAQQAQARERPAWRRLPGSTWRLATLVRSARELLAPHAPLLPLMNVPFLVAAFVSALLVPILVAAALVVILAAATT
jgi:hypothetical protein